MTPRLPAFIVVGAVGFVVQMTAVFVLATRLHVPYVLATALAVEAAVLHNFVWHECWTWGDRPHNDVSRARRLFRFNLGTGMTSIAGNVIGTAVGVELLHMPTLAANGLAVVATSLANFLIADRWVFRPRVTAAIVAFLLLAPSHLMAADLRPETVAAWHRHIATVESTLQDHERDAAVTDPQGRAVSVRGGSIHEWRGSAVVKGITVVELVHALQSRGLPPPSDDILAARVLERDGDRLRVYMKITRSAIVTVTYDTEHEVRFSQISPTFATSRSVSTRIQEDGGGDRGFLWRLNSYWRYRQQGSDVVVDVLSESLSRDVPSLARPIAGPIVDRIARESMRRTLDAVERFGNSLRGCALPSTFAAPHC